MADAQDGPSLAEPYARLIRAREHVDALHAATEAFFKREGYAITKEGEPKDGWETLVFEVRETPPLELSLILSDALHNWRAALDNLASQLVRLNGGTPDENTYFPIFPNQTDFEGKRGQRRLRGMSDAHKAAIAEMQPYPGRSTPRVLALETVHTLAKRDRHRALHATFASPAHIDMPMRFLKEGDGPDPIVSIQLLARGKRLEHGTPFVRLRRSLSSPLRQFGREFSEQPP